LSLERKNRHGLSLVQAVYFMPDINHYYIDEAGDLDKQSRFFLVGCVITSTPEALLEEIDLLEMQIKNSGYFYRFRKEFLKTGFHACTNHPDIYSQFVALLPRLNFRYYARIVDKESKYYGEAVASMSKEDFYDNMAIYLLKDRLLKRKSDINKLFFEQNLPKPTEFQMLKREGQLRSILLKLNNEMIKKGVAVGALHVEISVQNKKTQPLFAVVDFINHIVMKVYEGKNGKVDNYMKENYRLIEPKIGCIHDVSQGIFHQPRKRGIDIDSIFVG